MKRIDIRYGDSQYSVGGRELAEVQAEIASLADEGGWLTVNEGEGAPRPTYLWIAPGVQVAVTPVPGDGEFPRAGGRAHRPGLVSATEDAGEWDDHTY